MLHHNEMGKNHKNKTSHEKIVKNAKINNKLLVQAKNPRI